MKTSGVDNQCNKTTARRTRQANGVSASVSHSVAAVVWFRSAAVIKRGENISIGLYEECNFDCQKKFVTQGELK